MTTKSIHTTQPSQLSFDWSASSLAHPDPTEIRPQAEPTPSPTTALPPNAEPLPSAPLSEAIALRNPAFMQVLPWDFRSSFPPVPDAAIEAGKIYEDDAKPDNIKALHEEHAQHGVVILATLDALLDAKRRGVDPCTGKAPKTPKQKEALETLFLEEPARLERSFNMLMDAYEDVFGGEAADAFRKAIRAWQAGVEVIAEHPPSAPPLPASVQGGVFGVEEDGTPVDPEPEEFEAITDGVANNLLEITDEPSQRLLLEKYAEDFGQPAATELGKWAKGKVAADEGRDFNYDPGHPWYYYHEGDGAEPPLLADIPARATTEDQIGTKFPKNPVKRRSVLERMATDQARQLADDERRYQELTERGVDALSKYDREISSGGNEDLAWATAIALKYSHICWGKGRAQWLEKELKTTELPRDSGGGPNPDWCFGPRADPMKY